jgi:hypothetical protein
MISLMKLDPLPVFITDWIQIASSERPGDTGLAHWGMKI